MLICASIGSRIGAGVRNLRLRWNLSHGGEREKLGEMLGVLFFFFFQKIFRFFLSLTRFPLLYYSEKSSNSKMNRKKKRREIDSMEEIGRRMFWNFCFVVRKFMVKQQVRRKRVCFFRVCCEGGNDSGGEGR